MGEDTSEDSGSDSDHANDTNKNTGNDAKASLHKRLFGDTSSSDSEASSQPGKSTPENDAATLSSNTTRQSHEIREVNKDTKKHNYKRLKALSSSSNTGLSSSSESNSSSLVANKSKRNRFEPSRNAAVRKGSKRESVKNQRRIWDDNPDEYGIRRSSRSVKKPDRLQVAESDSEKEVRKKQPETRWQNSVSSEEYNSCTDKEDNYNSKRNCHRGVKINLRARSAVSSQKAKKTKRSNKVVLRKRHYSSTDETSSESSEDEPFNRQKVRRTAVAVSYKEDDSIEKTDSDDVIEVDCGDEGVTAEADNAETIEKVIAQRRGKRGVVGNQTTVYAVEENGDPNEDCDFNDLHNTEVQYLIKWKGWSHIHNTWESLESLKAQKVKGLKKVENYVKREEELAQWKDYTTPEDAEYFECQLELQQDLLKSYYSVERIIAEHSLDTGTKEYYVKWESLPYAEATWEDAALIERKWPQKIREFHDREDSKRTPSKFCRVLKYRPKFVPLSYQPGYMGSTDEDLELRDYQLHGLNWLIHSWCKENSVILADEMGLGKTIQTICFLYYLFNAQQLYGPFLVVVPLSTMTSWQREFCMWAPDMNVVTYIGDVSSRNVIREFEWCFANNSKRLKFNVILTTYEILLKDKALLGSVNWAVLMVDEAHRLKNDDSLLYKALMDFITNHRLLITGTPLQNSLKELWALLHFIMPNKFDSWEKFEHEHENAALKGYQRLHKQLEPCILRRVKKEVEKSLPAKVEQILRVEMTSVQKQFYRWILTKNYDALRRGSKGSTSTFLNIVIELKKCCNHSLLIRPSETSESMKASAGDQLQQLIRGSGKLVLLDKLLIRLKETGHRVLIFSQMVRMLDILAEYLQLRHFPFQRLDGGIKGEIRRQALDHFNAENSQDFCFLLSTRAGGLGINLATADTVIIFDSDWNPQNDLQAQARAHRIGQKNQVNIYRLVTKSSVEEDIVERAKKKMVLDHLVIQRMDTTGRTVLDKKSASNASNPFNKEELTAILKFGAADLFRDDEGADEEPACDIDEILRRAETRDEAPAAAGDELLSNFKMANFKADESDIETKSEADADDEVKWDEIIPENYRQKVEEAERAKEMEDMYLPPRSRKALQVHNYDSDAEGDRQRRRAKGDDDAMEGSDDERPRKRGRPRMSGKEVHSGFTDSEIRRIVKSYKRFPAPLKRLEAIACDAELQEKPLADIRKLCSYLRDSCYKLMRDYKEEPSEQSGAATAPGRKKSRGPILKVGGVSVNAKAIVSSEQDLEPLDKFLPSDNKERAHWTLELRVKNANYDVEWDVVDDSKLLRGVYQYGMGSWEAIKMDPSLDIGDKILANNGSKPQAKHLQARAEYLLKVMRKRLGDDPNISAAKARRPRKPKEKACVSKEVVEGDETSDCEDRMSVLKDVGAEEREESASPPVLTKEEDKKPNKKDKKEPRKRKNVVGPMHYTANSEPRALASGNDLEPSVFNACKEMMRPVKKALRALDRPDESLSPQEQVMQTTKCLLEIGDQINKCLEKYKDAESQRDWKSNLWYFVSKFTEFDAKRLFKLYKHAVKKLKDEEQMEGSAGSGKSLKMDDVGMILDHLQMPSSSLTKHRAQGRSEDRSEVEKAKFKEKSKGKRKVKYVDESSSEEYRVFRTPRKSRKNDLSPSTSKKIRDASPEKWMSASGTRYAASGDTHSPETKRKRRDGYHRKAYNKERERLEREREFDAVYIREYNRLMQSRRLEAATNAAAFVNVFPPPLTYYQPDQTFNCDRYSFPAEWHPMMDVRDYRRDLERRGTPSSSSNPR